MVGEVPILVDSSSFLKRKLSNETLWVIRMEIKLEARALLEIFLDLG